MLKCKPGEPYEMCLNLIFSEDTVFIIQIRFIVQYPVILDWLSIMSLIIVKDTEHT